MIQPRPTLDQLKSEFPFPWRTTIMPNGLIRMIDATGSEVSLLSVVALCEIQTAISNG